MLPLADDRMNRARMALEQHGLASEQDVSATISESWKRCLSLGLDPQRAPTRHVVEAYRLRQARSEVALLRRLVLAEMENLYHQIAGTNFMIAFAGSDGLLLDTLCDPTFTEMARNSLIRPGTFWTEAQCGTNALGTAAHLGRAVTVHGREHFFASHGALTCTAVPLFGADGTLAGILDASSDCQSRQQHTQALVNMAAAQIENGLFREAHRDEIIIAFHSRAEYLHTLSAGLLAINADGLVLAVNTRARFLLQGLPATPGRQFAEIYQTPLGDLLMGARSGLRQRLEDRVGSVFAAKVETVPSPKTRLNASAAPNTTVPRPRPSPPVEFVAEDAAMSAALQQVAAAARRKLPILIRGATGTGKEQLARYAHQISGRAGRFVPVNCAALPETLAEAELFGHVEGAFTGARRGGAPGLVAESDGGTLFLDEIGDMKPPLQSVLLRLLDDWMVRPVGGGSRRKVNVFLVAATNTDLQANITDGIFRADLFYRINTVEIHLPPLAQRRDFAAIARRMLAEVAPCANITSEALALLAAKPWPGNMRELRSELTRLTLTDPERTIRASDITVAAEMNPDFAAAKPCSLRALLAERVRTVHHELNGNVAETARRLSVSRNTVYRALMQSAAVK